MLIFNIYLRPKVIKIVKGEGMPIHKIEENPIKNIGKPLERGDLKIKFEIEFPTNIPLDK